MPVFGEALTINFTRKRCDMRESDPKNDPPTRKIEKEVEQQADPKEVPDSGERESPRRERGKNE